MMWYNDIIMIWWYDIMIWWYGIAQVHWEILAEFLWLQLASMWNCPVFKPHLRRSWSRCLANIQLPKKPTPHAKKHFFRGPPSHQTPAVQLTTYYCRWEPLSRTSCLGNKSGLTGTCDLSQKSHGSQVRLKRHLWLFPGLRCDIRSDP